MSFEFVEDDRGFVWLKLIGKSSVEDYVGLLQELERMSVEKGQNLFLVNNELVAQDQFLSAKEVRHLTDLLSSMKPFPGVRIAVIANSELAFGMSRMFQSFSGTASSFGVFKHETEALGWLFSQLA